jgi:hypothetical protein
MSSATWKLGAALGVCGFVALAVAANPLARGAASRTVKVKLDEMSVSAVPGKSPRGASPSSRGP